MKTEWAISNEDDEFKGDERWELVQRVIASKPFQNSARLRDFLLYVTSCALRNMPEEATEQHIGIHVFGRRPGFSSNEDSIVRSQARLLRIKLATYYKSPEGQLESTSIQIPKGHYLPVFLSNSSGAAHDPILQPEPDVTPVSRHAEHPPSPSATAQESRHQQPPPAPLLAVTSRRTDRNEAVPSVEPAPALHVSTWSRLRWVVLMVGIFAIAVASFLLGKRIGAPAVPDSSVILLWKPFLSGDKPLVIYSNASFVGDSRTGMHYANPTDSSSSSTIDTYTGIGELSAVSEITKLFDSRHADFVLKRSRLVTWDEARLHNLVFIGSIAENASLQVMPQKDDFALTAEPDQAGFINQHPKPGEASRYMRPEHPLTRDYAVVAFHPGVDPNLHTLAFSGLTTLGTEAAVEFAVSAKGASQLLSAASQNNQLHPFDALLEVDISGGVPIQSRLVCIHTH